MLLRSTVLILSFLCGCEATVERQASTPAQGQAAANASASLNAATNGNATPTVAPAVGSRVSFESAGISMVRPEGFVVANTFLGLAWDEKHAFVMVAHAPGPVEETRAAPASVWAKKGMTLKGRRPTIVDGTEGELLMFTQFAQGQAVEKAILLWGDASNTFMVTALCPVGRGAELWPTLTSILESVRRIDVAQAPSQDLGFEVMPDVDLVRAKMSMKAMLFTRNGVVPVKSPGDPTFMVGPSIGPAPMHDTKKFAEFRLANFSEHYEIKSSTSPTKVSVDGLDGWLIVAKATDRKTGAPLALRQTILFREDRFYFLLLGSVGASERDRYFPVFKKMTESFKRGDEFR